ncbi:hypothetical protein OH76DRAFT_611410 [Lentinus brumalis]|uniref:Uncharacterized protein n=1 Tax=Lentinus brumalis TaxID=2498619 RepID=A0A371DUT0_9APHY|nr:hypothetical protein OH76DRAFT_611410 [Polyporus brumalis]
MEMLVPVMNSRRRDPQILSSLTVPSAYLLAAFSAYLQIPRALAVPAASDPSSSSPYSPPPTASDIVSPSPPVEFASSSGTHLSTYGIVGIVISGSLFMTAVIGYGLRSWKRYKRSRLPPSAQYRESVRVAAKEEAETAAAEGGPASSGAETREVGGGGAGVGGQGAAAASRQPDSEAGKSKGEGASASASASRDLREQRTSRSSSSRKPARGTGSKSRRDSKSRSVTFSDAGPSAGPGPSTEASRPQPDLSGIEEVPR